MGETQSGSNASGRGAGKLICKAAARPSVDGGGAALSIGKFIRENRMISQKNSDKNSDSP